MLLAVARASLEAIEPYIGKSPARGAVAVVFILALGPTVMILSKLIQTIV
jgi:hypothetical protein